MPGGMCGGRRGLPNRQTGQGVCVFESASVVDAVVACDHFAKACPDVEVVWLPGFQAVAFAATGRLSLLKKGLEAAQHAVAGKQVKSCLLPRPADSVLAFILTHKRQAARVDAEHSSSDA